MTGDGKTYETRAVLPLVPNRVFRTYLGGRLLDQLHGRPDPHDSHYPEEWIASTTLAVNPDPVPNEGLSQVRLPDGSTPLLVDLLRQDAPALLGDEQMARFGAQPDILVKFLDSAIRLHVQVHPLPAYSRRHLHSDKGKTEAWIVLQVRGGEEAGYVYLGFQRPPIRQAWARIIEEQDIQAMEACFEPIPVRAGDVFIVHGAVPHAIGPGILMVELQEPSDFVVRCEFERGGYRLPEAQRFMNLDLETALDMFDYSATPRAEALRRWKQTPERVSEGPGGAVDRLIGPGATDKFRAYRISAHGPLEVENGRFSICAVVEGEGRISAPAGAIAVRPGSTFVAAAACEAWRAEPDGPPLTILMARRF